MTIEEKEKQKIERLKERLEKVEMKISNANYRLCMASIEFEELKEKLAKCGVKVEYDLTDLLA